MSAAPRLSLFYAAVFLVVGIQLPFWPVWLSAQGLSSAEIGFLLAAGLWVKVAANPLIGVVADRLARRRALMLALGAGALAGYAFFGVAHGFPAFLGLTLLTSACFSALLPLGETLAVRNAYAQGLDYGRMRLWGSISFILAALGGGALLATAAPQVILTLLLVGIAAVVATSSALPELAAASAPSVGRREWRLLLFDRRQLLFLASAALIQASHAVYYAFGSLYWRSIGYSTTAIGWLWAEGVLAEIALFFLGARLVGRLGPARLLVCAGLVGTVRWTATAYATTPLALIAVQTLHALTFGAAHLAAMHFIARAIPVRLAASGQALYSAAVAGVGSGIAMAAAGPLYAAAGPLAYLAMAVLTALGAVAGWALVTVWREERALA